MTSFAVIFGVLPLAIAVGPGAEMRQALGTAVVFGMLGVTLFGLIFTPVFYVVTRGWSRFFPKRVEKETHYPTAYGGRTEESRVGKECVKACRAWGAPRKIKKKKKK